MFTKCPQCVRHCPRCWDYGSKQDSIPALQALAFEKDQEEMNNKQINEYTGNFMKIKEDNVIETQNSLGGLSREGILEEVVTPKVRPDP